MAEPASNSRTTAGDALTPDILMGLANLELVARSVVDGFFVGLHRSPQFGFSQEFAEYRAYEQGDDPRFIDWNVFARTERTYIKRYLGETNTQLTLLVDASASMGFSSGAVSKLQMAKYLAAALCYLASRQHDAAGLILFDERIREFVPASARSGTLHRIMHMLERTQPAIGTDFAQPFVSLQQRSGKRGLVAVISDFYCSPESLIKSVRPLTYQGQDIICFQVLDPQELAPDWRVPVAVQDMETGEALEVAPDYIRQQYPERLREHLHALKDALLAIGADHQVIDTSQPLNQALRSYLLFRQRRM